MHKMLFMLGFLAVVCNCSHTMSPKVGLLRPWGVELEKEEPFQDSYLAIFEARGKTLIYIAGNHATSNNDLVFELVEKSIKKYPPEILILEGHDPSTDINKLRERAKKCSDNFVSCGEKYAAIFYASPNTKILSGEPYEVDLIANMDRVVKRHELLYFYLLRQIPQMRRQGDISKDFESQALLFLTRNAEKLGVENRYVNFELFIAWYREHANKSFLLDEIDTETPAPVKNGTYFQNISYQIGLIRDANIVRVIADQLNQHTQIMVLYGSSHLVVQLKVLEEMMGKPKFTQKL